MDKKAMVVKSREFNAMAIIVESNPQWARRDLAAQMRKWCSKSSLRVLLNRMVDQGLIDCIRKPSLTPLGQEVWTRSLGLQKSFLVLDEKGRLRMPVADPAIVEKYHPWVVDPRKILPEITKESPLVG